MADDEVPDWAVIGDVGPRGELFLRDESEARLVALAVISADLDMLLGLATE